MLPRTIRPAVCLLLAVAGGALAVAQTAGSAGDDPRHVDASQFGERVSLGPNWLFAPNDNPAYASAGFDDSGWKIVSTDRPLIEYGIRNIPYCWYRAHIHLRPGTRNVAIGLERTYGSYEVYVNGVQVGANGDMSGLIHFGQRTLVTFTVSDSLLTPRGDLVLALRFSVDVSSTAHGRGTSSPLRTDNPTTATGVYLLSREAAPREISYANAHVTYDDMLLGGLSLLAGLVALALCLAMRSQREYLAATIYLLASTAFYSVWLWDDSHAYTMPSYVLVASLHGIANFAIIEFVRLVLGRSRSGWLLALQLAAFLAGFGQLLAVAGIGGSVYLGFFTFYLPLLLVDTLLLVMLVRAWRQGNREARVLLPAVVVMSFGQYWGFFNTFAFYAHIVPVFHPQPVLPIGSYRFTIVDIEDFVFYVTMLLFLVLRTVTIARERAHAAAELEAAHTTQQLLLARSSQPTPGFQVESVYYPASEVGGDFFLVSSSPNGGLIAIVGDVSGKGLIAAMRVAMILGVLRREDSWEPAGVLHNLNEALLTHEEHGFTTACCVRIEQDGRYTLANAGHLYPYIDGKEIATGPGLPLGISSDQHYVPVSGILQADQKIVLVSDGVLEARSASGELLGFDRLAQLTLKSAREIADTAKAFGQQDDITALTLARTA
jgi:sigma-B regulation protein RsbU (phosphoserine phosphatase)